MYFLHSTRLPYHNRIMKRNLAIGVILFGAIFGLKMFAAPAVAATAPNSQPLKYGVWLPFWKAQDGAEDVSVNLDKLDEVSPFSYEIGTNGKIIDDANINNGSWAGWFSAAHELGAKIIPTVAWFNGTPMYNCSPIRRSAKRTRTRSWLSREPRNLTE